METSRITPLPKRGFGPPPRTVRLPPPSSVSALFFSCTEIHDRADEKLFWRVQKFSGERVLWYVFLTPYVLQPPLSRSEKESIHRPAPVQNFSLPKKNGGHRGKISVVDMVFLVFIGSFCIHLRPGNFSLRPEKFPTRFSFGGGGVRFLLLCHGPMIPKGPNLEKKKDLEIFKRD